MKHAYTININGAGIDEMLRGIEEYKQWLQDGMEELCKRAAEMGQQSASAGFAGASYDGPKDVAVTTEPIENGYKVRADGESALFIEFGSGVTMGGGHPDPMGFGPGTWPDKHYHNYHGETYANWEAPDGWHLPKEKGGGRTYGNPPAAAMYNARKEIEESAAALVQEVFGGG